MSWKPKLWHALVALGIVFVDLVVLVGPVVAFGRTSAVDNKFGDQLVSSCP